MLCHVSNFPFSVSSHRTRMQSGRVLFMVKLYFHCASFSITICIHSDLAAHHKVQSLEYARRPWAYRAVAAVAMLTMVEKKTMTTMTTKRSFMTLILCQLLGGVEPCTILKVVNTLSDGGLRLKPLFPFLSVTSEGSIRMDENEDLWVIETDQGDGWTRVRRIKPSAIDPMPEGFVPTSYIETTELFSVPHPVWRRRTLQQQQQLKEKIVDYHPPFLRFSSRNENRVKHTAKKVVSSNRFFSQQQSQWSKY